jgi:predicted Fe-Mo cluster-binding NifX family protein
MKTAFTYWDNRIAPVFDIAHQIRVVESDDGRIVGESEEILEDGLAVRKVINLAQLGIATLVCGAISRPLYDMVMSNGILVIPFVAGDLGDVIQAWLDGTLDNDSFSMPGCCGRGRGYGRVPYCDKTREDQMNQGSGGGQGRGQGGGRMGGPQAGGALGFCVCAKCGHREPHQRGVPCVQKQCPKCGTALTRE